MRRGTQEWGEGWHGCVGSLGNSYLFVSAITCCAYIGQVISDMASFAAGQGMILTSVGDVKNGLDLMSADVN